MEKKVDREKFLIHLSNLIDGDTSVPCTYFWDTEVIHHGLRGQKTSDRAYESFWIDRNNILTCSGVGREGNILRNQKDQEINSIIKFLDKMSDANLEFFIGMKKTMSIFAYLENE